MRHTPLAVLLLAFSIIPVHAGDPGLLNAAFDRATRTFERALPQLPRELFGVDVAQYHDGLKRLRFASTRWGGTVRVEREIRPEASGSCGRFAAFVRVPPQDGAVRLVLCPQFFTPRADSLRELTILHEMVHVVAGTDECQAMAFAAAVQQAATGAFTPVTAYWRSSKCAGTDYNLP